MVEEPRGIRNENPGNLKRGSDPWQGLAEQQTDPTFYQFESAPYGIRAMARVLLSYQDKRNLRTVAEIINRWAPNVENPTVSYINAVCERTKFKADELLDLHTQEHLKPLVLAIIWQENGVQPYPDSVIDKGLVLAGVEAEKKSLVTSNAIQGSSINIGTGAIAATAATVGPLIPFFSDLAELIERHPRGAIAVMGGIVLFGGALSFWAKWRERARGIS